MTARPPSPHSLVTPIGQSLASPSTIRTLRAELRALTHQRAELQEELKAHRTFVRLCAAVFPAVVNAAKYASLMPSSKGQNQGDAAIKSAIQSKSFDALALLRNILVHKEGVPDGEFRTRAADVPGLEKWISCNSPIELDGEDISNLINPFVKSSIELMRAVDQWIMR